LLRIADYKQFFTSYNTGEANETYYIYNYGTGPGGHSVCR
jgi:hypothetical protein